MPEEAVRKHVKSDRMEYDVWVEQGWIKATPGDVVDDRQVREDVIRLSSIFDIQQLAFDPYGSRVIAPDLNDAGIPVIQFEQLFTWYDVPTRELLNLILQNRIIQERNPVTRFCATCMSVNVDSNDRVKPAKPDRRKSNSRIDGIVSRIMALDRGLRNSHTQDQTIITL